MRPHSTAQALSHPDCRATLSSADPSEALEVAAGRSGRPAHLVEKDTWVVWTLSTFYAPPLGDTLTLKVGSSLSKGIHGHRSLLQGHRSDLIHPRTAVGPIARWQSHPGVTKSGEKDPQCGV